MRGRIHPQNRLRQIIKKVKQLRVDTEWWNNHRAGLERNDSPIDVGPLIVLERAAEAAITAWGTDEFQRAHELFQEAVRKAEDWP